MRYLVATILLAIGIVTLGVAVMAKMQLNAIAREPAIPDLDDYPALMLVAGDLFEPAVVPQQAAPPIKAFEIAQRTNRRVWLIGFAGIVAVVMGLVALVLWPKPRRHAQDTFT